MLNTFKSTDCIPLLPYFSYDADLGAHSNTSDQFGLQPPVSR